MPSVTETTLGSQGGPGVTSIATGPAIRGPRKSCSVTATDPVRDAPGQHDVELASAVFADRRDVATLREDAIEARHYGRQIGSLRHAVDPQAHSGFPAARGNRMFSASGGGNSFQEHMREIRFGQLRRRLSHGHPHILRLKTGKSNQLQMILLRDRSHFIRR